MMDLHHTKSIMGSAHVASWLSSENVFSTRYQNAYEPNLISDSELVCFLVVRNTQMKHASAWANNGNVIKSRSVVRVVASQRWSKNAISKMSGVPGRLSPQGSKTLAATLRNLSTHMQTKMRP